MPRARVRYAPRPHQREFQEDTTSKFLHLSGGFGSGKSHALVMKAFQLSRLNRGIRGGCVVPSIAEYKKDFLPLMEAVLEESRIPYRYHRTDKWWKFPWSKAPMDVATAERRIRGPNWGWAVINEASLLSHESFKEVIGRVRVKGSPNPQIACSGTPEGTAHWLYETFVETPMKGSRIIYGDTRDNLENLSADYIATLEASYDDVMLDAYLRGLFVNMKGNRFYYAYDPKRNDDATIERIPGLDVHVSLDYNVAPMVATLWHIVTKQGLNGKPLFNPDGSAIQELLAFDAIIIDDGAETQKMARAFSAHGLDPASTVIYPDPAGRARSTKGMPDNEILRSLGWSRIRVKTVAPQFRKRQLAVCNLLSKGLIRLNPIKCKALKRDMEAVTQDPATFEKDKNNPKLTHASDGMDYFVDLVAPLSGQKPDSRVIKIR